MVREQLFFKFKERLYTFSHHAFIRFKQRMNWTLEDFERWKVRHKYKLKTYDEVEEKYKTGWNLSKRKHSKNCLIDTQNKLIFMLAPENKFHYTVVTVYGLVNKQSSMYVNYSSWKKHLREKRSKGWLKRN